MNNRITIKNISTSLVYIIGNNFRRALEPGREIPISRAIYDDLMYDPGFNNLLTGHFIIVNGVKDEDAVVVQSDTVYDISAISEMFNKKDYAAFAKFLPNATAAEKDTVIKLAVERGITDNGFTALIKKYCDVDVISAINFKHLAEEK